MDDKTLKGGKHNAEIYNCLSLRRFLLRRAPPMRLPVFLSTCCVSPMYELIMA